MKLSKPVYDSSLKVYNCIITNGVRFVVRKEEGAFTQDLNTLVDVNMITDYIVKATAGWFTKPLTNDFLKDKLRCEFPTDLSDTFEGEIEYELHSLTISKEVFLLTYKVIRTKEDEKVCIEFEEDAPPEENIPMAEMETLGIGPTRQETIKQKVLKARAKAARALFIAERLTQEYYEEFGEDTDWEDETLSDG
jgi:hypothetical protein